MRIKLIYPSRYLLNGGLLKLKRSFFPSLTFPLLAALTPEDIEVSIIDETVEDISFDETADLVGLTAYTTNIYRAYEIADEFRRRRVPVVMGGLHVSEEPEEALEHADAVFLGEAEDTWPQFLRDFRGGTAKKIYRPEKPPSLVGLPIPRYSLINQSRTVGHQKDGWFRFLNRPLFPVQTSRGCPYSCIYCAVSKFYGKKIRFRPVSDVIKEIQALNAQICFFIDENIFANPQRAQELFEALIPLKIHWVGQATMDAAEDRKLIRLARKSGCLGLCIGLESLSQKVIESLGESKQKANVVERYEKNIQAYQEEGIAPDISLMFGFDDDEPTVFQRAYDFLIKNQVPYTAWWPLTPLPGTKIFQRLKAQGRLKDERWWLNFELLTKVLDLKFKGNQIGEDVFAEKFLCYYRRFYSSANIMRRFLLPPRKGFLFVFYNLLYSFALQGNLKRHV